MRGTPEPPGLRAQGAISVSRHGGWRLGWLSLDEDALTFSQPGKRSPIRIGLDDMIGADPDRRTFVLVSKPVIRVTYRAGAPARPRSCWVITARLAEWAAALAPLTPPRRGGEGAAAVPAPREPAGGEPAGGEPAGGEPAGRESVDEPAETDAKGAGPDGVPLGERLARLTGNEAMILDYLAHKGHATTAELMTLLGAEAESTVLRYLRDGFRRLQPVLEGPAIRYEGSFFDRSAGVVRRQAWRADETVARGWLATRPPADVLVEGDDLVVVTTLPTRSAAVAPRARIGPGGAALIVTADGGARWIALPEPAAGEARCAVSPNGTLVVRARRLHGGGQVR